MKNYYRKRDINDVNDSNLDIAQPYLQKNLQVRNKNKNQHRKTKRKDEKQK